ncbi:MAG: hypothetical protein ACRBBN_16140 [Methyloligellaceae bacterium]
MFRNLKKIKIIALLGSFLLAGLWSVSHAEARTSKAYCKTVRTIVFADKSKIEAKRTAYTKCGRFNKEPWKMLSRKVRCRAKGKKRQRMYRCQCFARICKLREAKAPKKEAKEAPKKESAKEVVKETPKKPAEKQSAPVIKRVSVKPAAATEKAKEKEVAEEKTPAEKKPE